MSKLIHVIWLWVMLVAATCGPCATFAYDYYGEIRPNYDGFHESVITYDGVPAHINGEEKDGMTGEHLLLATFAKFLAAETTSPQLLLGAGSKYNPWTGAISSEVTSTETTMFRVWGDGADKVGGWLSPTRPASQLSAIRDLALPVENSAQRVSGVTVPAGTRIQIGTAGQAFGQPGGASQVLLLDRIPPANFGPGVPLGPR